jgi:hypothetical protein
MFVYPRLQQFTQERRAASRIAAIVFSKDCLGIPFLIRWIICSPSFLERWNQLKKPETEKKLGLSVKNNIVEAAKFFFCAYVSVHKLNLIEYDRDWISGDSQQQAAGLINYLNNYETWQSTLRLIL